MNMQKLKIILINKINNSDWRHVPPQDPLAYQKRGKFLASTYLQAEFYGRPKTDPERVKIYNPVFGFSEIEILNVLFGKVKASSVYKKFFKAKNFYKSRINLDAKMAKKARLNGYDSIVLMTQRGKNELTKGRKPSSIELNLLNI